MPLTKRIAAQPSSRQLGFTLIEIIVGITVLSIGLSIITTSLLPTSVNSAAMVQQIRSAELAQAVLNEILSKSYDENSDRQNGIIRCNEVNAAAPTCTIVIGNEGEGRADFDDVDDYHCDTAAACANIYGTNLLNNSIYQGFSINVNVAYDGDFSGHFDPVFDNKFTAKFIKVTVTDSVGEAIVYSTYRTNF